ncbi:MAG: glutathione S-transferase family protein [Burkholderiales bacterium]
MLKLYGSANSRALRVLWMLGELGLKFEHLDWLPRAPQTRTPEFRVINPNARVPVIDDDGFVLAESMAINLYLAKKHKSALYPADTKTEALAWQWSLWETDRLDRQLVDFVRHSSALPAAERKPEIAEKAFKEVAPALDVLEIALGKSPWLAGSAFTVADLNVAGALYRALTIELTPWPKVKAWLNTCWERPAAKHARTLREKSGG